MEAFIKDGYLNVKLPINKAISKSGKSIVIATTNGGLTTGMDFEGKKVVINLNAYVPAR